MQRSVAIKVRLFVAVLSIAGLVLAAPAPSLASCVPPQLRPFADEPGSIVVAGTVLQTNPTQVAIDVQLWWGADPQPTVVIERPVTDPTVISSTDWAPQAGEQWVVLARRDRGALRTSVCDQMPATAASVGEVESSLGAGVVPPSTEPTTGGASPEPGVPGWMPIVTGVVLVGLAVVAVVALNRRRGGPEAADAP